MRDDVALHTLIEEARPKTIVYAAGATSVDRCEHDPLWALGLNAKPIEALVRLLPPDAILVYISSDYVFDGSAGPYDEDATPRPINRYGETKLAGERLCATHPEHIVIRTTVVYGYEARVPGKNSLCQLLDRLGRGEVIHVPADEVGTPTYVEDVARAIVDLVRAGARGTFHVAGPDWVSRADYARVAATTFGLDPKLVIPVESESLGRSAARPKRHGLVSDRAEAILGWQLAGVSEGLTRAFEEWPR